MRSFIRDIEMTIILVMNLYMVESASFHPLHPCVENRVATSLTTEQSKAAMLVVDISKPHDPKYSDERWYTWRLAYFGFSAAYCSVYHRALL